MSGHRFAEGVGDLPHPDGFVGYTIVRLAHAVERRIELALVGEGLTVRQFGALVHLARDPGIGSGQLARLVLVTPQSMGALVQSLERAGFVTRAGAVKAGTRIAIRLTRKGTGVMRRAMAVAERVDAETAADLSTEERRSLNDMLHRMLKRAGGPDPAI